MDFPLFFSTIATLFAIMDPIGTVGIFIAITPGETETHRRNQAFLGCIWALLFMALFFAAGSQILHFFGITVDAVQVGGGLILLKIAFDQLSTSRQTRHTAQEDAASRMQNDVSVFPLAMPLIAGPGALTLMIAEAARGRASSIEGWFSIGGAVLVSLTIMWIALDRSVLIQRLLGANGLGAITRLMGFLLACIAAQMTIVGIRGVVANDHKGPDAHESSSSVRQPDASPEAETLGLLFTDLCPELPSSWPLFERKPATALAWS
ncbi:MAG: MarC family protein [Phycisphaerales bacterium]|nr:MarC family protein [Phycisphaerales bacterium]